LYIIESLRASIFLREKLIKMKKMEALYHLTAAFGHEIRQPTTVSKGMLQLLNEDTWSRE
jgi:two-component system sporulation sensor kinase B